MIVIDKISSIAELLADAARSRSVVGFRSLHALFEDETHRNDVYDTLEAGSRSLCLPATAIYSAVMAKTSDDCPGIGFYDIFNNLRREEFMEVAGHNDLLQLTEENRKAIAAIERERVYQHAEEHF